MTWYKRLAVPFILGSILVLGSCFGSHQTQAEREKDANTAAGKAGQAAQKAVKKADQATQVLERKLEQAAHDAHAGWQKAAADDKAKGK